MHGILGKRTLFIALGVFVASQHVGLSKADDKLGSIEGKVSNALVRSNPAVVYVTDAQGSFPPPKEPAVMDQEKLTFIPKVLPILVGSTVNCPNNDKVQHNIFSPPKSAKQFNLGLYPPGASKNLVFTKTGVVPLLCNVHAEMSGFIVVLPNPYFTTTDKEGAFKIEDVPAGKYKLTFWHEKLRPKTVDVTVTAGKASQASFSSLSRGKYSVKLVK